MTAIRLSLRNYVLITLLVMGVILISSLSYLSFNNFFEGMDGVLRGTMISAARNTQVSPGQPVQTLNFTIAARWEDLPEEIQHNFHAKTLSPFRLEKQISREFFFFRPDRALFVLKVTGNNQPDKFVSQIFSAPPPGNRRSEYRWSHEGWTPIIGFSALIIFAGLLLILLRSIARPTEHLRQWAKNLDEQTLDAPIPSFRYRELDELARLIHHSLQDVRHSLHREQAFVRHASHELRTPIAVIRSSIELLHKLPAHDNPLADKAIHRIDNASHTMTDLTETLLWLGKRDTGNLPMSQVSPGAILTRLTKELHYLLDAKPVKVTLQTDHEQISLPVTAFEIVAGNLIRNAYQHTQHGEVMINQEHGTITIKNWEYQQDANGADQESSGFGLGLQLVRGISEKLQWSCEITAQSQGFCVVLTLK